MLTTLRISGYTDVKSFVKLAQKIESVGASSYLGLARHINDTTILNAGAVRAAPLYTVLPSRF